MSDNKPACKSGRQLSVPLSERVFERITLLCTKRKIKKYEYAAELIDKGMKAEGHMLLVKRELDMSLKDLLQLCREEEQTNAGILETSARSFEVSEEEPDLSY